MIFTDLYKSPKSPLSRLRHPHQSHLALQPCDYDPDLVSKDKAKQKEAVKRHLQAKVRNDWTFAWPPVEGAPATQDSRHLATPDEEAPLSGELEGYLEIASDDPELNGKGGDGQETASNSGEEADSETDSVYSTISEARLQWKPRLEWASELSDDELPYNSPSPFKYDSPDSIGQAVNASKVAQKIRRRRELRKEMAWNDGLACFEARRNLWTDAKVARNGAESDHSISNHLFPSKTSSSDSQKHSHAQTEQYPVETLLPIPPPLLPPANPMRASITPALYSSIYEKVVVHSLQPSCPINLGDMVRACVVGWKRDGHGPGNEKVKGRRESIAEEGSGGSGKGIKRSLQKVLGIGQHPSPAMTAVADGNTAPQAS
ncbi:hypothetical protein VSDG_09765 [Cytospora chrysosperma]|uniref:Gag1-like clamp domain-containing protein n=1 Tax=Cytospora chrysosperma TaxID=252740 RepID=A0A423V9H4_CYTCH|nr:hypothetical protein VSDG_09765 [Valsa sordida]